MLRAAMLVALAAPASVRAQDAGPVADPAENPAEEAAYPPEEQAEPAPEIVEPLGIGNDIVVTAGKREQVLAEIPVAVSVIDGAVISRAQVRDLQDLSSLAPSLRVSQLQSPAQTNFIIRGFGNGANNAGIEPSVGVFVDGVYRSRSLAAIADLPDVSRVEVLRGPQTTLFGKTASAGVISVTTQAPQFETGGWAEASYGADNAVILRGAVTGAVSSKLALALSAGLNRRDGYVRDASSGAELNNRNRWFVRGQALFEVSSQTRLRVIGDYDRISETCCAVVNLQPSAATMALQGLGGQVNAPGAAFAGVVHGNFAPSNRIANWGASGQIDHDLGPFRFSSITAWRETQSVSDQDADFTSADLISRNAQDLAIHSFTQELRVATSFNFPVQVVLGVFWHNERISQSSALTFGSQLRPYADALIRSATGNAQTVAGLETLLARPAGSFFASGSGTSEAYRLNNRSFNLFGQVDLDISDRATLTGGIAYIRDSKRYSAQVDSSDAFAAVALPGSLAMLRSLQFVPPFLDVPNSVEPGRTTDARLTTSLKLAFDLSDRIKLYGGYTTGFKASSINLSRDSRPFLADAAALGAAGLIGANQGYGNRLAGPEAAALYEAGIKAGWDRVTVNLAAFRQVISGFQSNLFTGTGFVLTNAARQSVTGLEVEASVRPVDPLAVTVAVTWLDPRYDSFTNSPLGDLSGTRPAGIPALSASWGLQYTQGLPGGSELILRGDYHYEAPVQIVDGLPGFAALGSAAARPFRREVSELGLSLSWVAASGLELGLWARNLLDSRHLTSIFDSPAQTGSISGYPSQPRSWGFTARHRF